MTNAIAKTVSDKKVGANVKPVTLFSKKNADFVTYEVKAETGTTKIKGGFPVTLTISKREKYEIVAIDETKFYGIDAEKVAEAKFFSLVGEILAGTYRFPEEIEAAAEAERVTASILEMTGATE